MRSVLAFIGLATVLWAGLMALCLLGMWMLSRLDRRHVAISVHVITARPCPLCHVEGVALVDSDGVALCTACRCSYEVVAL